VRIGSDEDWDFVEGALERAIRKTGNAYEPTRARGLLRAKLDFKLTDAIGRQWQCGTFQVDPNLPTRLGAEYVGEDGASTGPYMLHRAILGSFERFIGILIENYAGRLPFWLAPRQVVVASIVSDADPYVREVVEALTAAGIRAEADTRNEKINYKVREHSVGKVPVILALGMKEVEAARSRSAGSGAEHQVVLPLGEAVTQLAQRHGPRPAGLRRRPARPGIKAAAAQAGRRPVGKRDLASRSGADGSVTFLQRRGNEPCVGPLVGIPSRGRRFRQRTMAKTTDDLTSMTEAERLRFLEGLSPRNGSAARARS
jgi:hypothetical protein